MTLLILFLIGMTLILLPQLWLLLIAAVLLWGLVLNIKTWAQDRGWL